MNRYKVLAFALLATGASVLNSCDNTTVSDAQIIADLAWRPDGTGMLGLVERTTQATLSTGGNDVYDLYRIGADGHIADRIGLPTPVYQGYFPGIFLSSNGQRAIVESGSNIVRVDLASNTTTVLLQSTYILGASPDLKYVVTTTDGWGATTKLCTIYDVSAVPSRRVTQFNAVNVSNNRALWLQDYRFGMTHLDTTGTPYVLVYDTLGRVTQTVENAELAFHASGYSPVTNELFVRDRLNHIARVNLETGARSVVVQTASVLSLDVSRDGSVIAYTSLDTNQNRIVTIENVATRLTKDVGTEGIAVFLNPQATKLAYIRYVNSYNQDIPTVDVTLP